MCVYECCVCCSRCWMCRHATGAIILLRLKLLDPRAHSHWAKRACRQSACICTWLNSGTNASAAVEEGAPATCSLEGSIIILIIIVIVLKIKFPKIFTIFLILPKFEEGWINFQKKKMDYGTRRHKRAASGIMGMTMMAKAEQRKSTHQWLLAFSAWSFVLDSLWPYQLLPLPCKNLVYSHDTQPPGQWHNLMIIIIIYSLGRQLHGSIILASSFIDDPFHA